MALATGTQRGTSLESLVSYFQLALESEGKTPKTIRYYVNPLRLFLGYASTQGWYDVHDIDAWALRQFLAYLRNPANPLGKRCSHRSREYSRPFHYWRALRAFFQFLNRERLVLEDPLQNIRLHRHPPENTAVYSPDELARIDHLCQQDFRVAPTKKSRAIAARNHAMFLVVLDTGLRLAELASLSIDDLVAETGIIRVRRGKGGKSRLVRAGTEAKKSILRYLVHRVGNPSLLWVTEECGSLSVCGVEQVFRRLCHRSGVKFKGVHAFRRNWCVASLRNGADLRMVQILGGWSTLAMPVHYSRTLQAEDALEMAARVSPVDHLLGKGRTTGKK